MTYDEFGFEEGSTVNGQQPTVKSPMNVTYDEFGFFEEAASEPEPEAVVVAPAEPHIPMREQFPEAGSDYMGGTCDGWEYRSMFAGSRLAATYEMVRQFLREEGYGDVPLPESAEELRLFKRPRHHQLQMFGERGYMHNPIKILFPNDSRPRNALIVCVYNEQIEGHLLWFHGVKLRSEGGERDTEK
jgi:hypothetical protein